MLAAVDALVFNKRSRLYREEIIIEQVYQVGELF
jgi:hypothetical protein